MKRKIGLFGGSFDPVHSAHLTLASVLKSEFDLDKVFFIPNCSSPFKDGKTVTDVLHRIEMIKLAIAGNDDFLVSDFEARQGRSVFTCETVEYFRSEYPEASLGLIIGKDSLMAIKKWKNYQYIVSNTELLVAGRNCGSENPLFQDLPYRQSKYYPEIDISSTLIREMVSNNINIKYLVNDNVQRYIIEKKLYCKT